MQLLGQDVLHEAGSRNKPLRKWLQEWILIVEAAEWRNIDDLRRSYPSADGVRLRSGTTVTVFNAKGNLWRLLTCINYRAQYIVALEVLTHADYNKNLWKQRY